MTFPNNIATDTSTASVFYKFKHHLSRRRINILLQLNFFGSEI